ncbi:L-idonate 5-dehydrogenase [Bogoriella caseilytica]|uniref:L-idonate 5-dehydrogenase n=1 Tax=Bogoriella caseilytica TaxID=56055 RepID=A0A3N2BFX4_9MICO|nr:L-idonate 5-dehydrogenase [Bogoriella caseilytica]ROR74118.1 L-idonate 5-dehydrogenase [Bogoriella caseilytica]
MRTVVIHGKRDLRLLERPVPEPGDGELRLRVAFAGICGSDLHYYSEGANGAFTIREPLVPGHEISATVDLDPAGEIAAGTPVAVHPAYEGDETSAWAHAPHLRPGVRYLGSASTWPHTQGGMSEYLVMPRGNVRFLPQGLSLRRAALAEPTAVALHGLAQAGDLAGRHVLVAGAGPIGLLAVAGARSGGASEVTATDIRPGPLERARAVGATETIDVTAQKLAAESFDIVLECSGAPSSVSAALRAARRGATYVQLGMLPDAAVPLNLAPIVTKELTARGAFRFHHELEDAIELLASTPSIEQVITHEFPADQALAAFEAAMDAGSSGKVVVTF